MSDKITPQPLQTKALQNSADILIFGGGAGVGKTRMLLMEPLYHITRVENFTSMFFRRTYPEITNEGGLWDESKQIYPLVNGNPVGLSWRFFLDKEKTKYNTLSFAHMQHEKDKYKYQGSQITLISFDELTHFSFEMFIYMLSRNRSTCGVKPYIRATTNPDPDSWVKKLIQWWIDEETGFPIKERSGVKRYFIRQNNQFIWGDSKKDLIRRFPDYAETDIKSLSFINGTVYDNPILIKKNPEYLANLKALDDYEQKLLLYGNWNVRKITGDVFKEIKYKEWDNSRTTKAYLDSAYSGKNNTSLALGYNVDNQFTIKGYTWRKSVTDLYDEILILLAENNCHEFYIEKNADKGLGSNEFKRRLRDNISQFPIELQFNLKNIRIIEISEHANKHIRIMHYAYKNWSRIFFHEGTQKEFTQNVLGYQENKEPDDEIDSVTGLIKVFTMPIINNKPREMKISI